MTIPRRVHEYEFVEFKTARFDNRNIKWPLWKCKHCDDTSGLYEWQLITMPSTMATCNNGRKLSLLERVCIFFTSNVDCLADGQLGKGIVEADNEIVPYLK